MNFSKELKFFNKGILRNQLFSSLIKICSAGWSTVFWFSIKNTTSSIGSLNEKRSSIKPLLILARTGRTVVGTLLFQSISWSSSFISFNVVLIFAFSGIQTSSRIKKSKSNSMSALPSKFLTYSKGNITKSL